MMVLTEELDMLLLMCSSLRPLLVRAEVELHGETESKSVDHESNMV